MGRCLPRQSGKFKIRDLTLCAHSPKTTLELLRRLQKHRVQLGEQRLTGICKTSVEQLDLFEALGISTPV